VVQIDVFVANEKSKEKETKKKNDLLIFYKSTCNA
jgi:hypothetical protein